MLFISFVAVFVTLSNDQYINIMDLFYKNTKIQSKCQSINLFLKNTKFSNSIII